MEFSEHTCISTALTAWHHYTMLPSLFEVHVHWSRARLLFG